MNDDNEVSNNSVLSSLLVIDPLDKLYGITLTVSTRNDDNEVDQELIEYDVFPTRLTFDDLNTFFSTLTRSSDHASTLLYEELEDAEPIKILLHGYRFQRAAELEATLSIAVQKLQTYIHNMLFNEQENKKET